VSFIFKRTLQSSSKLAQTTSIIDGVVDDSIIVHNLLETKPKPKLILHVGPQKTGTTSIQYLLEEDQDVRAALLEDNYTVVHFNFRQIINTQRNCFLTEGSNCILWDELVHRFDDAYEKGNSVILSVEELSNLKMNDFTKSLWQSLLDKWDIQVLLFYRPFHEWIYSMYVQHRKSLMYRSGQDRWIEHFGRCEEVKNFPEWLEDYISSNLVNLRDTIAVKASFEELYGSKRVHVLDMLSPHGIELEFLGNAVVNAVQAYGVVKRTGTRHKHNTQSAEVLGRLDTDLIIVQAHRRHYGDLGYHTGGRNTARIKLEAKLKEWNMTTTDLLRVCVTKQQEDWLWKRTLHAQKMLSKYPILEEELSKQFALNRNKWCGVNAKILVKRPKFQRYLNSCEFQRQGCNMSNLIV